MDILANDERHSYGLNENAKACKLVTGFWPDDSRILDKFDEDQQIVVKKYGLPSMDVFRNDPAEYERQIRKSAKEMELGLWQLQKLVPFFILVNFQI